MASIQGICKNCGSLIVLNDREDMCECLFCDCFFSSAEAIEIAKNPSGYNYPNLPQPKRDGVKKFNVTPVYPDPIPAAVKRAEVSEPVKKEKNPYEVSPDDIKPPKSTVRRIFAIAAACVVIVVAIYMPLYLIRMNHRDNLSDAIGQVFDKAGYTVNISEDDGYYVGFSLTGQKNNVLSVSTDAAELTSDQIYTTFTEFAKLRGSEYDIDPNNFDKYYGDLKIEVIAGNGIFAFEANEQSELTASNVEKT
jgi:hypothetical protein